MSVFWAVTLSSAVIVIVMITGVAVVARRLGRVSIIDVAWGPAFALVAVAGAAIGQHGQPFSWTRWTVATMVVLWGLRLGWHVLNRSRNAGEDPRYERLLSDGRSAVRAVWLPQGAAIWFVSLPVQVAVWKGTGQTLIVVAGVSIWALGLFFESVGDAQLAAFKRRPHGPVMDRGLWAWTRHPNYFGDACVWWGIWLVAAGTWQGALTMLSPVAMTYFLVFATGARHLESTVMRRPGYREYARRTSMFVPLPPRKLG